MIYTNILSLKKELSKTMETVAKFDEQVIVATKRGNVVIISEKEYNSLKETLHLCSQRQLTENIKLGEKEKVEKMKPYSQNEQW